MARIHPVRKCSDRQPCGNAVYFGFVVREGLDHHGIARFCGGGQAHRIDDEHDLSSARHISVAVEEQAHRVATDDDLLVVSGLA